MGTPRLATTELVGSGVGPDGLSFTELERWGRQTASGDLADLAAVVDFVAASGAAGATVRFFSESLG